MRSGAAGVAYPDNANHPRGKFGSGRARWTRILWDNIQPGLSRGLGVATCTTTRHAPAPPRSTPSRSSPPHSDEAFRSPGPRLWSLAGETLEFLEGAPGTASPRLAPNRVAKLSAVSILEGRLVIKTLRNSKVLCIYFFICSEASGGRRDLVLAEGLRLSQHASLFHFFYYSPPTTLILIAVFHDGGSPLSAAVQLRRSGGTGTATYSWAPPTCRAISNIQVTASLVSFHSEPHPLSPDASPRCTEVTIRGAAVAR